MASPKVLTFGNKNESFVTFILYFSHLIVPLHQNWNMDNQDLQKKILNQRLYSSYATEYGTFVGMAWVLVFALYVCGMRSMNPLTLFVAMMLFISLPAVPMYFANRLKQQMGSDTVIGYGRAYWFAAMMFMYACLLSGGCEYVYFRYMDHGALVQAFRDLLTDPNATQTYIQMGMGDTLKMMEETVDALALLSPLELTLTIFNQNIFISLVLAFFVALFAKRG